MEKKTEGVAEKCDSTCAGRHGNGSQGESLAGPPEDSETQAEPSILSVVVCIGTRAPIEVCQCIICDRRRVLFSMPVTAKSELEIEIEELPFLGG